MTNHGETTGSSENDDSVGSEQQVSAGKVGPNGGHEAHGGPGGDDDPRQRSPQADELDCTAYDGSLAEHQVTLRTPDELADALPYLLG
ncbi:MAG: DUF4192 domain-containing protein, partial [Streptomyces sp.]|nr:DUF4192 domain-containing protein [Streptomyces sp.]